MPPRHGTLHIDRPALAEPVFEFQRRHQYRVVKQIGFDREGNRTAVFGDLSRRLRNDRFRRRRQLLFGAVILRFRNGRLRSRRFRNAGNILSCRPCAADCRRNRSGRRLPNAVFPVGRRVQVFDADQCHDVLHAVVGKRLVRSAVILLFHPCMDDEITFHLIAVVFGRSQILSDRRIGVAESPYADDGLPFDERFAMGVDQFGRRFDGFVVVAIG